MDTLTIQLTNQKAYKLLKDMKDLDLIKVLSESPGIASLRGLIKTPMSNEDVDKQLNQLREEWKRDF